MIVTFIIVIYGLKRRYAMWRIGQSTPFRFTDRLCERITYFIKSAVLHKSILKMVNATLAICTCSSSGVFWFSP